MGVSTEGGGGVQTEIINDDSGEPCPHPPPSTCVRPLHPGARKLPHPPSDGPALHSLRPETAPHSAVLAELAAVPFDRPEHGVANIANHTRFHSAVPGRAPYPGSFLSNELYARSIGVG